MIHAIHAALWLGFASFGFGQSVLAIWQAPQDTSGLVAYELSLSGTLNNVVITTNTQTILTNLIAGTYRMSVTSIGTNGIRSLPTPDYIFSMPGSPTSLRITNALQYAPTANGPWMDVGSAVYVVNVTEQAGFYRAKLQH
jgi:hypothetical protein